MTVKPLNKLQILLYILQLSSGLAESRLIAGWSRERGPRAYTSSPRSLDPKDSSLQSGRPTVWIGKYIVNE